MSLFAVVYQDDLEKDGRSTVFFNVGTPNANFKHYAQPQSSKGGQVATMRGLLAQVR